MLFVLAERELELDSKGDSATFYKSERPKWSERLRHTHSIDWCRTTLADKMASIAESIYEAEAKADEASA